MYCFNCSKDSPGDRQFCKHCGYDLTSDPDRYFKSGVEAVAAGEAHNGVRLLEDCLTLSPHHLNARYNLGIALCLIGEFDRAREHFITIARQEPRYPGIYTALGQVSFGKYIDLTERAETERKTMIHMFRRAINEDPEDVDAHFSLANAYMTLDQPGKAVPHLRRALELHPDSSAIHYTLAKALAMVEEYEEASEMARRSIDLSNPDDPFWAEMTVLASQLQQISLKA